jgi:autotransporter family porin
MRHVNRQKKNRLLIRWTAAAMLCASGCAAFAQSASDGGPSRWSLFGGMDKLRLDAMPGAAAPWTRRMEIASAGTGYSLRFGAFKGWTIEPQGQLIYLPPSNDYRLTPPQSTALDGLRRSGWTSRLGVRMQHEGFESWGWRFRPYTALNWWRDDPGSELIASPFANREFPPLNRYELKTGVDIDLAPGMAAWSDLGWQRGSQSYQVWTLRAGMRYAW